MLEVNGPPSTEYVNGALPPVTAPIVSEPLFCPHAAFTGVTSRPVAQHSVVLMLTVVVYTQPFASLTAMVLVPAARFVKLVVLPYAPPSIEYS